MITPKKREITYDKRNLIASKNADRLHQDTSSSTKQNYFRRFYGLYNQNKHSGTSVLDTLKTIVEQIEQKRALGKIQHSSLRQYKACLMYALTQINAVKSGSSYVPVSQSVLFEEIADAVTLEDVDSLSLRVMDWGSESGATLKQQDVMARSLNQTSTAKMKHLPLFIYQHIMSARPKSSMDALFQQFVYFNVVFGLRPVEWFATSLHTAYDLQNEYSTGLSETAQFHVRVLEHNGDKPLSANLANKNKAAITPALNEYVLKVKNAKHTHGRSCGAYRYLRFFASDAFVHDLQNFIRTFQESMQPFLLDGASEDSARQKILSHLKRRMQRVNATKTIAKQLDLLHKEKLTAFKSNKNQAVKHGRTSLSDAPTRKAPTLYSTRHQAIANAKAGGYSEYEIAALFGHISAYTADKHYGRAVYGGSSTVRIQPSEHNLNIVLESLNADKIQSLANKYGLSRDAYSAEPLSKNNTSSPNQSKPAPTDGPSRDFD